MGQKLPKYSILPSSVYVVEGANVYDLHMDFFSKQIINILMHFCLIYCGLTLEIHFMIIQTRLKYFMIYIMRLITAMVITVILMLEVFTIT